MKNKNKSIKSGELRHRPEVNCMCIVKNYYNSDEETLIGIYLYCHVTHLKIAYIISVEVPTTSSYIYIIPYTNSNAIIFIL